MASPIKECAFSLPARHFVRIDCSYIVIISSKAVDSLALLNLVYHTIKSFASVFLSNPLKTV